MCPAATAELTIRRAEAADADAIAGLVRAARIHSRSLDWRNFAVAAAASGELVGCLQIRPSPGGYHELKTVAVASAWRRRGVARALGDFIVPASPRPLFGICLGSMSAFYERFGATRAPSPPRRLRFERAAVNLFLRLRGRRDRAVILWLER